MDTCISTGLVIANGRLLCGQFTYCSVKGKSTVDYLLLNYDDFETITNFKILELNEFSDRAPITFSLLRRDLISQNNINDNPSTIKLVWDKNKATDECYCKQ